MDIAYAAESLPVIEKIKDQILNPLITLLFVVALIVFLWGVFQFIKGRDSEKSVETGKQHMVWGIVGLFIMVSAFGILNFVADFVLSVKNF